MKVAVVGATGLVGTRMLEVLAEKNFPVTELIPVASAKSVGRKITFQGKEWTVVSAEDAIAARPDLALFSAGGSTSAELAPKFAAVGTRMREVLAERNFPVTELLPVASAKSVGRKITFQGKEWTVVSAEDAIAARPDLALFSAGGSTSAELAPKFAEVGTRVVDNSSHWRMDPTKKLVVPEINGDVLEESDYIIANPNCSTIQMLLPLWPLHKAYTIKRVVVSTYQSVTGTGYKAMDQMTAERAGGKWGEYAAVYPHPIDQNILPHIDSFLETGYTKEEMKMVNETHKIFGDDSIGVSPTTVRVPVQGGHSESINLEFEKEFTLEDVRKLMEETPGVTLQDDPANNVYPMPLNAWGKNDVFVGRFRKDPSVKSGLNFWCVADNLRKGAATNAVQIAEKLIEKGFLTKE